MSKFIIQGGKSLVGEISANGSKNAATPIIAATLLTEEECIISNVPDITDVRRMLEILQGLGSQIKKIDAHTISIINKNINLKTLDKNAVAAMRSSVLFIGPLLARLGEVTIPEPGGCIIGNRPIDTHLEALRQLGTDIKHEDGGYILKKGLATGGQVVLREFSVTATENLLMACSLTQDETIIKLAAAEPHVQDLGRFLISMGVKIDGLGTHTLTVNGKSKLKGTAYSLITDLIEVGTFAVLATATSSRLLIRNIDLGGSDSLLELMRRIGIKIEVRDNLLEISPTSILNPFRYQALPYPGLPTDLQAPFGVLATQCRGTSLIHDPLYEGRLGYVAELIKMGANATLCDPHRVLISGPTPLYGTEIKSLDLRAGATLLIAGLIAEGETIINDAEVLDRGYERIDERLKILGAKIDRVL